jgi:ABC-type microcin C transport system permease subunit YejB
VGVGNARPAIFSLHPSNGITPEENYRKGNSQQPEYFGWVLSVDLFFCMIYRTSSYLTENAFLHRFVDQYVSNIKSKNRYAVVQVVQNR